ncbi:MAG TPA: thermonuclease [Aquificaceae bacterium]|nr:thermonuclease [Aquificaceae bacterium]
MKKFLTAFLSAVSILLAGELIPCKVVRVIDGDTFKCVPVNGSRVIKVRLMGIDTLETHNRRKAIRQAKWFSGGVDTVISFGKEAKKYAEKLIDKKIVFLEPSVRNKDKRGRMLAYVWLDEDKDEMLNVKLVEEGLAFVFIIPPQVKYLKELGKAQEEAYEGRKGFWEFFKKGKQ